MMRGRFAMMGLAVIGAVLTLGLAPIPAAAQSAADLQVRLQRLERDMRDLQAETFRRTPGARDSAAPDAANDALQRATPDIGPLMRRLDDLERSLVRLTGQMEELGHQVDLMSRKTDQLQKQLDYQAAQTAAAGPASTPIPDDSGATVASVAPSDASEPILRPLPPQSGVLGQIPANTPLPTESNNTATVASPEELRQEFDGAMGLLSRAQYDEASAAFRRFTDSHPEDDRAGAALYWSGDIAYSVKKDYEKAARDFAELLKNYPMATRAPEGMLKLGLSLFELGQTREGCAALAALPAKYPDANANIETRARNERRSKMCR